MRITLNLFSSVSAKDAVPFSVTQVAITLENLDQPPSTKILGEVKEDHQERKEKIPDQKIESLSFPSPPTSNLYDSHPNIDVVLEFLFTISNSTLIDASFDGLVESMSTDHNPDHIIKVFSMLDTRSLFFVGATSSKIKPIKDPKNKDVMVSTIFQRAGSAIQGQTWNTQQYKIRLQISLLICWWRKRKNRLCMPQITDVLLEIEEEKAIRSTSKTQKASVETIKRKSKFYNDEIALLTNTILEVRNKCKINT
ncbi:unnamed protein product [Lactuca saligna]|uniref:Uncharacterized protein n=1 Tax=Lactuca saligna TaxID=75948 RepID=A0AA35UZ21_LACSI|nr:unnamed protein product [Lactuca saligna]